jgi:hypothetical protein
MLAFFPCRHGWGTFWGTLVLGGQLVRLTSGTGWLRVAYELDRRLGAKNPACGAVLRAGRVLRWLRGGSCPSGANSGHPLRPCPACPVAPAYRCPCLPLPRAVGPRLRAWPVPAAGGTAPGSPARCRGHSSRHGRIRVLPVTALSQRCCLPRASSRQPLPLPSPPTGLR